MTKKSVVFNDRHCRQKHQPGMTRLTKNRMTVSVKNVSKLDERDFINNKELIVA